MRLPRLTVLQALLLVAVIAVGLDSLVHPTRYRIRLLLWVEVSLLVFASFLARGPATAPERPRGGSDLHVLVGHS